MRVRVLVALLCILIATGSVASLTGAQEPAPPAPPPTVTITLGPGSVGVAGAENLAAGPTRIEVRGKGRFGGSFSLLALRAGETVATLRAAVLRSTRGPAPVKRVASFEASGQVAPRAAYVTTVNLRPGVTYVAANTSGEPRGIRYAPFTIGATPSGAVPPAPAATVGLYDYAFGMPPVLPRRGTVRFENRGQRLHIAVAVPLRRGASRPAAVRAALRGQERRLLRMGIERDITEPVGIVSPGAVNDVEVRFPRAGDYVMVCFLSDGERGNPPHNTIGMVTPFRVR